MVVSYLKFFTMCRHNYYNLCWFSGLLTTSHAATHPPPPPPPPPQTVTLLLGILGNANMNICTVAIPRGA